MVSVLLIVIFIWFFTFLKVKVIFASLRLSRE